MSLKSEIGTKMITKEDLNEANSNIHRAIGSLQNEIKTLVTKIETGNEGSTNSTSNHLDTINETDEQVILVVGGYGSHSSVKAKVEAISSNGSHLCPLPDFPDWYQGRREHTLDENILCGGMNIDTCSHYIAGKWTKYGKDLSHPRFAHVSWRRPDGQVVLMGGHRTESKKTSEVVFNSTNQEGFDLKYKINNACAIKLDEYVIITGGENKAKNPMGFWSKKAMDIVSKYNKSGWVMDLPSLNIDRAYHGCGHYYSDTNELIYLVTGGTKGFF